MRLRALWIIGIVVLLACVGIAGFAQAPASPTFEVASVKPNTSGNGGGFFGFPGGQFRVTNMPLRLLIGAAYGDPQPLPNFRIIGGPSWADTDRFDIVAKPEGDFPPSGPPPATMFLMLRSLLIERFKLMAHSETRDLPIFELVLARTDGKLGQQLHKSDVDCAALFAAQRGRGPQAPPPPPLGPGSPPPMCGLFGSFGRIAGGATNMDQLSGLLSRMVNRPVVNKTGLMGNYDFDVTFTPEQMPTGQPPTGPPQLPQIDPNGPSIYTALQEQLGLKLDSQKGPVDVLVIDHVEHPTPD